MTENRYELTMEGRRLVNKIARVCHEVNRAFCEATGDHSQAPWAEASDWQVESARAGVRKVLICPGITPEQLHEEWMALKISEGWVYGPMKDADAKQHPCLVPYSELPMEQRLKDHLFRAVALAMAEGA